MLALRMSDEDWQAVLDVDLSAPFRLARAALRGMLRRRAGRIINICSIVGATGNAGQANYAAAKAGLIGMTKALAQEVASRGITVNAVAPGFIVTAMTDALPRRSSTKLTERHPAGPPRRAGKTSPPPCVYPRLRRGGLGHRRHPARQRRHGDAVRRGVRAGLSGRRETMLSARAIVRCDVRRHRSGPPGGQVSSERNPVRGTHEPGVQSR